MENLPRVGRPRKLSHRDENWIMRAVKSNRYRTLNGITQDFIEGKHHTETVHKCTVHRFLKEQGYKRKAVRKRIVVREVNRKNPTILVFRETTINSRTALEQSNIF